jgi:hypothetical protein
VEDYLLRDGILYIRARSKKKLKEIQIDIEQEQLICNEEGKNNSIYTLNYPAKSNKRLYINLSGIDKPLGYEYKNSSLTLYKPE